MPRLRQKTKQMLLSGLVGVVTASVVFAGYTFVRERQVHAERKTLVQDYETKLASLREQAQQRMVQGWVPTRDIPAGNLIAASDLKRVELPANSVPADLFTSQEAVAGKYAKVALRSMTPLTETLVYEEAPVPDDLRWREMAFVQLPQVLKANDVIDIRIQFPTGHDYILLSKKKVANLSSDTITVTLDEAEILSLSSAIVDAYLHKASIYALAYVEPNLQSKPVPTYPVNEGVMELIRKDPNIVEKAERALKLSNMARSGLERDLSAMSPQRASEFARQTTVSRSQTEVRGSDQPAGNIVSDGRSGDRDQFELDPAS
ncbi:SAF domain-containing protein [Paenibacillus sp. 3LSP]|uniref:SAF domain-containing protein n=1 Tax=Paenibacillus sp. 3LSP TaxID=2800795 RepID=UPI0028FD3DB8|nr:SAF domain-containing protein [Paenibacillus sp. 3LSP]MDU0330137.1 SAF domain-containing protein [Paenibacillus sp. 3LSP]